MDPCPTLDQQEEEKQEKENKHYSKCC